MRVYWSGVIYIRDHSRPPDPQKGGRGGEGDVRGQQKGEGSLNNKQGDLVRLGNK